jgi:hypothetical protein
MDNIIIVWYKYDFYDCNAGEKILLPGDEKLQLMRNIKKSEVEEKRFGMRSISLKKSFKRWKRGQTFPGLR